MGFGSIKRPPLNLVWKLAEIATQKNAKKQRLHAHTASPLRVVSAVSVVDDRKLAEGEVIEQTDIQIS